MSRDPGVTRRPARLPGAALGALVALALLTVAPASGARRASRSSPATGSGLRLPEGLRERLEGKGRRGNGVSVEGRGMRASVWPAPARVGQALTYRAVVEAGPDEPVRFVPPRTDGALTWSDVHAGRNRPGFIFHRLESGDSVWMEARLQIFETGLVAIPGPVVDLGRLPGSTHSGTTRLPTVHVLVMPTVTAADSTQPLRGLHGPIGAPWWERLPLLPLVGAALALLAAVLIARRLARRKPVPARRPAFPVAPTRPRQDPAAEALRALAALRARGLPAAGSFGEHALELTAILRRFLEATVTTPRPGDTSGELLERLRGSRLPDGELERLEGLLGLWDRVKFARAPLTEAEAVRCEEAVESLVRRTIQARHEAEAAAAARAAAAAAAKAVPPRPGGPRPPAPEAA